MNRTTTIVVALIAAVSLSTMVYAVPLQRALVGVTNLRLLQEAHADIIDDSGGEIGAQPGPAGPAGPAGTLPVQEYVTFNSCSGTNGNHNVQCSIHIEGTSASTLTCTVANPAISGGDNTGNCQTDTGLHLSCVIPPTPGPFLCSRLS
jgi:hypothetical protein